MGKCKYVENNWFSANQEKGGGALLQYISIIPEITFSHLVTFKGQGNHYYTTIEPFQAFVSLTPSSLHT